VIAVMVIVPILLLVVDLARPHVFARRTGEGGWEK
jgi:hypothetical protein